MKKNNIDNFFTENNIKSENQIERKFNGIGPKGKLIQNIDGVYKYIPEENQISLKEANPVNPIKLTEFNSFDNYGFLNSNKKEIPVIYN